MDRATASVSPRRFIGGTLMALIVPPSQAPDEQHHFYRACQISKGHWVANWRHNSGTDNLPLSLSQSYDPFNAVRYNYFVLTEANPSATR
jgi:hypothetical protein